MEVPSAMLFMVQNFLKRSTFREKRIAPAQVHGTLKRIAAIAEKEGFELREIYDAKGSFAGCVALPRSMPAILPTDG